MSKELDELDGLFYVKMADGFTQGGTLTDDSKQAIKALISTAVREAQIKELESFAWCEYEGCGNYVEERLAQLKEENKNDR